MTERTLAAIRDNVASAWIKEHGEHLPHEVFGAFTAMPMFVQWLRKHGFPNAKRDNMELGRAVKDRVTALRRAKEMLERGAPAEGHEGFPA